MARRDFPAEYAFNGVYVESTREYREANKKPLLSLRKELVAPIKCRQQGLMALRPPPATTRQQHEGVVESCSDLFGTQDAHTRGCQFDREWKSIKSFNDVAYGASIRFRKCEIRSGCSSTCVEQFDSVRADRVSAIISVSVRQRQQ